MITTAKINYLNLGNIKTYFLATLFIIGNLVFPQLIHLIPKGGLIFLPIYFFTLVAAYKYGFFVGMLTAIFSPLANSFIFGMPPIALLPAIIFKSIVLAIAACLVAKHFGKVSLIGVIIAVLAYQLLGIAFEWILLQDLHAAIQDIRIGIPGLLIQIVGGFFLLKFLDQY